MGRVAVAFAVVVDAVAVAAVLWMPVREQLRVRGRGRLVMGSAK